MRSVSDSSAIPVSASTLESFREAAAGTHPTPAGVAIAAVSASFALGLLAKALAVSGRKSTHSADTARLEPLAATARAESSRMLQLAADDAAAFEAYLASARLPRATEQEQLERRRALDDALRRTIDVPLAAARSAAAGLELCVEAVSMTHRVVLADLGTAATLLSGALRAFRLCAESNVRQLAPATPSYRELLAGEERRHRLALQQGEEVLERVAAALEAAGASRQA